MHGRPIAVPTKTTDLFIQRPQKLFYFLGLFIGQLAELAPAVYIPPSNHYLIRGCNDFAYRLVIFLRPHHVNTLLERLWSGDGPGQCGVGLPTSLGCPASGEPVLAASDGAF